MNKETKKKLYRFNNSKSVPQSNSIIQYLDSVPHGEFIEFDSLKDARNLTVLVLHLRNQFGRRMTTCRRKVDGKIRVWILRY